MLVEILDNNKNKILWNVIRIKPNNFKPYSVRCHIYIKS